MAEYIKRLQIRSKDWNYGGPKWKLSRSKLDLFKECPLCFYLDNTLGVSRPKGPSFTLNIAVDALLKKEFDAYRAKGDAHPLMKKYGVDAIPFKHKDLDGWRENFVGIQYVDPESKLTISGAVDDIWINPAGELIVVDYKATSKDGKVETLSDSGWDSQYKRQMEVYQWLLRRKGFMVSDTGFFVYVNGKKDKEAFDAKLEFDVTLISHTGNDSWVIGAIQEAKKCLESDTLPAPGTACEHCMYRKFVKEVQEPFVKKILERKSDKIAKPKTKKDDKNNERNGNKTSSLF